MTSDSIPTNDYIFIIQPSRTIPQKQFQGSVRSTNASDFLTNPFGFIVRRLQHCLRLIHGAVSKPAGTARGVGQGRNRRKDNRWKCWELVGKDHTSNNPRSLEIWFNEILTINPQVGLWFNVLLETMLKKTTVWYFQFDLNSWELAVLTVCEDTG